VPGKKTSCASFVAGTGNFGVKPGLVSSVFHESLMSPGHCMMFLYLEALAAIAVALSVLTTGAWLVQQRTGNSGWVDTIWTFSLGLTGAAGALWPIAGSTPNPRQWLVAALVAIWSIRLGSHITLRSAGISDDPRYAAFAREWRVDSPRRMFVFLQNQGFGSIPLVFSIFVAARFPHDTLRLQDYLAVLVLALGIAGEALADAQLKTFRGDPANKGRVCDVGLWRWSRHPNYFFELFGWLAYPVIAIAPEYPWGWATLLAPGFMYWILVHVTGIPLVEAQMLRSRGERYRDYSRALAPSFHCRRTHDPEKWKPVFPATNAKRLRRDHAQNEGSRRMSFVSKIIVTAERVPLPDLVVRAAIQRLCSRTATRLANGNAEGDASLADEMAARAIAEHTEAANAQHYEVPAAFFGRVLGPSRKYSSCFYKEPATTLREAKEEALRQTVEHADLANGQSILELGCGWGSLSLWVARQFPNLPVVAVSNSSSQREFVEREALQCGLKNLRGIAVDMNGFDPQRKFDRIVSIEMFEHMMNWRALMTRLRSWLAPEERFFMHIFTRAGAYLFDRADREDWIAQHFFTGGVMPSHHLIRQYSDIFAVEKEWRWSGMHYQRTALDWLSNFDAQRGEIETIFRIVYGNDIALWMRRWRWFFLATAGLFGYADGSEWGGSHYRMRAVG
jgi:cyclopropane-fatty-acyl-phospholipid synthase